MIVCDFCGKIPDDCSTIVGVSPPSSRMGILPVQVTLCTSCAAELAKEFRKRKAAVRKSVGESSVVASELKNSEAAIGDPRGTIVSEAAAYDS